VPSKKISRKAYEAAAVEREARERKRALPHYTGKVAKKLATPPKRRKLTPSKRASRD
jgi:hypothetical protein